MLTIACAVLLPESCTGLCQSGKGDTAQQARALQPSASSECTRQTSLCPVMLPAAAAQCCKRASGGCYLCARHLDDGRGARDDGRLLRARCRGHARRRACAHALIISHINNTPMLFGLYIYRRPALPAVLDAGQPCCGVAGLVVRAARTRRRRERRAEPRRRQPGTRERGRHAGRRPQRRRKVRRAPCADHAGQIRHAGGLAVSAIALKTACHRTKAGGCRTHLAMSLTNTGQCEGNARRGHGPAHRALYHSASRHLRLKLQQCKAGLSTVSTEFFRATVRSVQGFAERQAPAPGMPGGGPSGGGSGPPMPGGGPDGGGSAAPAPGGGPGGGGSGIAASSAALASHLRHLFPLRCRLKSSCAAQNACGQGTCQGLGAADVLHAAWSHWVRRRQCGPGDTLLWRSRTAIKWEQSASQELRACGRSGRRGPCGHGRRPRRRRQGIGRRPARQRRRRGHGQARCRPRRDRPSRRVRTVALRGKAGLDRQEPGAAAAAAEVSFHTAQHIRRGGPMSACLRPENPDICTGTV